MLGIPNRGLVVGVAVVLTGVVAGCGGGSSQPTTGSVQGTTKTTGQPGTEFRTASVSGFGKVVVDGKGRTVYILTSGTQKNVPCTDASGCTKLWPDLPLPDRVSAAKAGMGMNASLLSTMKNMTDGETYPTINGWLVYEYSGDSGPGQANGQGIKSFGGTWYVLNASGNPIKSSSGGSGGPGGGGGGY